MESVDQAIAIVLAKAQPEYIVKTASAFLSTVQQDPTFSLYACQKVLEINLLEVNAQTYLFWYLQHIDRSLGKLLSEWTSSQQLYSFLRSLLTKRAELFEHHLVLHKCATIFHKALEAQDNDLTQTIMLQSQQQSAVILLVTALIEFGTSQGFAFPGYISDLVQSLKARGPLEDTEVPAPVKGVVIRLFARSSLFREELLQSTRLLCKFCEQSDLALPSLEALAVVKQTEVARLVECLPELLQSAKWDKHKASHEVLSGFAVLFESLGRYLLEQGSEHTEALVRLSIDYFVKDNLDVCRTLGPLLTQYLTELKDAPNSLRETLLDTLHNNAAYTCEDPQFRRAMQDLYRQLIQSPATATKQTDILTYELVGGDPTKLAHYLSFAVMHPLLAEEAVATAKTLQDPILDHLVFELMASNHIAADLGWAISKIEQSLTSGMPVHLHCAALRQITVQNLGAVDMSPEQLVAAYLNLAERSKHKFEKVPLLQCVFDLLLRSSYSFDQNEWMTLERCLHDADGQLMCEVFVEELQDLVPILPRHALKFAQLLADYALQVNNPQLYEYLVEACTVLAKDFGEQDFVETVLANSTVPFAELEGSAKLFAASVHFSPGLERFIKTRLTQDCSRSGNLALMSAYLDTSPLAADILELFKGYLTKNALKEDPFKLLSVAEKLVSRCEEDPRAFAQLLDLFLNALRHVRSIDSPTSEDVQAYVHIKTSLTNLFEMFDKYLSPEEIQAYLQNIESVAPDIASSLASSGSFH